MVFSIIDSVLICIHFCYDAPNRFLMMFSCDAPNLASWISGLSFAAFRDTPMVCILTARVIWLHCQQGNNKLEGCWLWPRWLISKDCIRTWFAWMRLVSACQMSFSRTHGMAINHAISRRRWALSARPHMSKAGFVRNLPMQVSHWMALWLISRINGKQCSGLNTICIH